MLRSRPTTHLAALDGLRGIASLCVLFHHIGQHFSLKHGFHHGYLAVPFFFTLSGYVIARAYESGLQQHSLSRLKFCQIRLVRLMPMIFLATALTLLLNGQPQLAPLELLVIPLLTPGAILFPANPPEWSLFFELTGNLLHMMFAKFITKMKMIILVLVSTAALGVVVFLERSLSVGWSQTTFLQGAVLFAATYLLGVSIYRIDKAGLLPNIRIPVAIPVILFLLLMAWPQKPETPAYAARDFFAAVIGFPVVVTLALMTKAESSLSKLMVFLGELSYPVYVIHVPIIIFLENVLIKKHLSSFQYYLAALPTALICILSGWVALSVFDRPIRRRLSNAIHVRRSQPSASPA